MSRKLLVIGVVLSIGMVTFSFNQAQGQNTLPVKEMEVQGTSLVFLGVPQTAKGAMNCSAIGHDGTVFFGGADGVHNRLPVIYALAPGEREARAIAIPTQDYGHINFIAVIPNGDVIFVGQNDVMNQPYVFRLPVGDHAAHPLIFPFPKDQEGAIYTIAVAQNGVAIFAGQNFSTKKPIIYSLFPAQTTANLLTNPNTHAGTIQSSVLRSGNTILLGGQDLTTLAPIIYTVVAGDSEVFAVGAPHADQRSDQAVIDSMAVAPNGTTILAGQDTATHIPLVYKIPAESSTVELIRNPVNEAGIISSIGIDESGIVTLGGEYSTPEVPLVWRLDAQAKEASLISTPSQDIGKIEAVAVDCNGTAVLIGEDPNTHHLFIYTLPPGAQSVTAIDTPFTTTIRSCLTVITMHKGLYNIKRLSPFYDQGNYDALLRLKEAGIQ